VKSLEIDNVKVQMGQEVKPAVFEDVKDIVVRDSPALGSVSR